MHHASGNTANWECKAARDNVFGSCYTRPPVGWSVAWRARLTRKPARDNDLPQCGYENTYPSWAVTGLHLAWRIRDATNSKNKYVRNTYHCVVATVVTHIQESLVGTLPMFVALTFHRAVRRRPTEVTLTDFRKDTASLEATFRTDRNTGSEKKPELN